AGAWWECRLMGAADGSVLGVKALNLTGPPSEKFNFVFVSEGYTADDMTQWQNDAAHFVSVLESTPPFDDPLLQSKINYFRVDVTSTDRGADKLAPCFATPTTVRTFFDAAYCAFGVDRLLTVDEPGVKAVLDARVPAWTQALVIVNDTQSG